MANELASALFLTRKAPSRGTLMSMFSAWLLERLAWYHLDNKTQAGGRWLQMFHFTPRVRSQLPVYNVNQLQVKEPIQIIDLKHKNIKMNKSNNKTDIAVTAVRHCCSLVENICFLMRLTLCSREHWSEAPALSASSQTRCSAAPPAGSGWWGRRACRTPGCQSGRTWGCLPPDESGYDSAEPAPNAWCNDW